MRILFLLAVKPQGIAHAVEGCDHAGVCTQRIRR
jgi:hypothetical protein